MIDVDALRAEWVKNGLTQGKVAEHLGMTQKTLSLKLKRKVLGSDEIEKLISYLQIRDPMAIFFKDV